jgi:hypothetical protein
VKKVFVIGGGGAAGVLVFTLTLVVFVNMRGGVSDPDSGLARVPVLGGLFKARTAAAAEPAAEFEDQAEAPRQQREIPFLRFGPEARLARLAQELESKKEEYDAMLAGVERRERELEAWQRQLKLERDALREQFGKEKEELTHVREELRQKELELQDWQVVIDVAEEASLKKTAEMCAKMPPENGAAILSEIYGRGEKQTVVKIIYLMEGRSAAKTLAALTDPAVSAEIVEQLKRVVKSPQEGGR